MVEVSPEMIKAFDVMWGNFPESVTLVHKSKEIVALNAACRALGREKGMFCSKLGSPEAHKGCLANRALAAGKPMFKRIVSETRQLIAYWLPLEAYPDFYIHFSVNYVGGTVVDYDAPQE